MQTNLLFAGGGTNQVIKNPRSLFGSGTSVKPAIAARLWAAIAIGRDMQAASAGWRSSASARLAAATSP